MEAPNRCANAIDPTPYRGSEFVACENAALKAPAPRASGVTVSSVKLRHFWPAVKPGEGGKSCAYAATAISSAKYPRFTRVYDAYCCDSVATILDSAWNLR